MTLTKGSEGLSLSRAARLKALTMYTLMKHMASDMSSRLIISSDYTSTTFLRIYKCVSFIWRISFLKLARPSEFKTVLALSVKVNAVVFETFDLVLNLFVKLSSGTYSSSLYLRSRWAAVMTFEPSKAFSPKNPSLIGNGFLKRS